MKQVTCSAVECRAERRKEGEELHHTTSWMSTSWGDALLSLIACDARVPWVHACLLACVHACLLACMCACLLACMFACLHVCLLACLLDVASGLRPTMKEKTPIRCAPTGAALLWGQLHSVRERARCRDGWRRGEKERSMRHGEDGRLRDLLQWPSRIRKSQQRQGNTTDAVQTSLSEEGQLSDWLAGQQPQGSQRVVQSM